MDLQCIQGMRHGEQSLPLPLSKNIYKIIEYLKETVPFKEFTVP
jgi:hypothetical protein